MALDVTLLQQLSRSGLAHPRSKTESRGGRPGLPNSPYVHFVRKVTLQNRAQKLCESRGGRPGLPVPNSPNGPCGRKATLKNRAQKLRESRDGRPELPVPNSPHEGLSVYVK